MEYNSFYGGKPGHSPIIVKSYKTINAPAATNATWNAVIKADLGITTETITAAQRQQWLQLYCMVEAFKLGNSYTTVAFDEYVIINSITSNDPDNGKVFRRGYDFSNAIGGAIYVGQIVGPTGPAPHSTLKSYSEAEEIYNNSDESALNIRKTKGSLSIGNGLVPGKTNDTIQYVTVSIRDKESKESEVILGFKIPYLEIDYSAKLVAEDYSGNLISRIDDQTHPFYEKWELSVPKSSSFLNIRIITASNDDGVEYYSQQEYDREHSNRIIVYDKKIFSSESNTNVIKTYYLGEHNVVKDTEINWFSFLGQDDPERDMTGISWEID